MGFLSTIIAVAIVVVSPQLALIKNSGEGARWERHRLQIEQFDCSKNTNCAIMMRTYAHAKNAKQINAAVNRMIRYQSDPPKQDVWATPAEIFNGRTGDCEEFMTAKVVLLRALQFDMSKVQIRYMKRQQVFHVTLTYDGEVLDYQDLSEFDDLFHIEYAGSDLNVVIK